MIDERQAALAAINDVISLRNESDGDVSDQAIELIEIILNMHATIVGQRDTVEKYSDMCTEWKDIINGCFAKTKFRVARPDDLRGLDLTNALPPPASGRPDSPFMKESK